MARSKRAPRRWLRWLLRIVLVLILLGMIAAAVVGTLVYRDLVSDLPDITNVEDYQPRQVTRVFAADGTLVDEWTDDQRIFRTVLAYGEIPQVMRDAMLAAEDSAFYEHPGLDLRGLVRAAWTNFRAGEVRQGASTITQQVVKNLVLSPERTYRRKAQELLLAYRLEQHLSKDDILTIYLNEVFFGRLAYGVEEASRYYFDHGIADVTLPQAALLAGLVQSPNRYNPYRHEDRALARRSYVLRQMYEKGMIPESVYREADAAPIELAGVSRPSAFHDARWYVAAAWRELQQRLEDETGMTPQELRVAGLEVHLALDLDAQRQAEAATQSGLLALDARGGYLRPYRQLRSQDESSRWRREHHADTRTAGLRAGQPYRGVIVRSDDEATWMAIGPWVVELQRTPVSRHRPDPERSWAETFPLHAVFTVESLDTWPAEALREDEPGDVRVRLQVPPQAAVVVMEPMSRHVFALVGGYDASESAFHRAVQARRQTGSAFKPFVFGAALEERLLTPATVYVDQPFTEAMVGSADWRPSNHDGRFLGPMSAREALARSRNTVTAQILRRVGVPVAQAWTRRAGVTSELPDGLSLALGAAEMSPLELTNAYATFAAEGGWAPPVLVASIRDRHGRTLYTFHQELEPRFQPEVAWLMTSMLRSVVTEGTGGAARRLPLEAVGKTGTTNGLRDAWFVGYVPGLVAGVWVGRDDFTPIGRREGGSASALPIWVTLMEGLQERATSRGWGEPPEGIESIRIDPESGLRAREGRAGSRVEFFLRGSVPVGFAPEASERRIQDALLGTPERGSDTEPPTVEESFDGSF